jgi:predicted nuclease with RNAse H fold
LTAWAGIDVGGARKGFDVAVIDEQSVIETARSCSSPSAVLGVLQRHDPAVVAVDSPRSAAPPGKTHRQGERALRDAVCGIRWTPDQAKLDQGNPYYDWIHRGLDLYGTLADRGWQVIEVFPTASWTRWLGRRRGTRAAWTRRGLARLGLNDLPARTNQDLRDAIAAAVTARQFDRGETEDFEEIVVPKGPLALR